jgi:hypothetical protein
MGNSVAMGEATVSRLRQHLTEQIARKVQAHGLVVWEDDAGEYRDAAVSVAPEGVRFEAFGGSWYELRRRVEDAMAGDSPPPLVLYGPAPPPDDPLAEIRAAGTEFKRKLSTLVRQALAGELTESRVAAIAGRARTLAEAEAAATGVSHADVRLIGLLGSTDTTRMLVKVLTGQKDTALDEAGAWAAVAEMCRDAVGADVAGTGSDVRDGLFRHLLLCEIVEVVEGRLSDALVTAFRAPAAAQRRQAADILERLRGTTSGLATYIELAERANASLDLEHTLQWRGGLADIPGTTAVDAAAFAEAIRHLRARDHQGAQALADRRIAVSPWVDQPGSGWGPRWRAVAAVAALDAELAATLPTGGTGELLGWYARRGWRVDRAHRRLELTRTELGAFGDLEDTLTAARTAYDAWLDRLLTRFTAAIAHGALDTDDLLQQGEIHDRFVAGGNGRTAYVWVDALRYELGVDLAEALRPIAKQVELRAAVAAPPTITPVGMANLLPGAASSLRVALADEDRLVVTVAGAQVGGVPQRRDLLRARHGVVADLDLNDASQKGERALGNAIDGAGLVLVRSQEVDAAGESGLLSVAWSHFDTVTNLLASVIARLGQAGIERAVISADHGFIALGQELGSQRIVDPPGGAVGTLKRRVFIGRGGTPSPATVRVPLAACGVTSDLDLIVPRGLAVFRAGGGRQFFHGGLSPQELLVPVIIVNLTQAPEPQKLQVHVQVAGGKITTGVFAATLSFQGDLFIDRVAVRVVAAGAGSGQPVARVVSGDGYDADTGTVTVGVERPSVLTFQVTANLSVGTEVDLQVLDARTGRKVAATAVSIAAPIVVEDELD